MLKFLSKVKIEFNASDPRVASCTEFLAQCNARKARESNPACQLLVKRRLDDHPPQIALTFVNGAEEVIDAAETPSQTINDLIMEKGRFLEAQKMFREAGKEWPVVIPEEELQQPMPSSLVPEGLEIILQKERNNIKAFSRSTELRVRVTSFDQFKEQWKQEHSSDKDDNEDIQLARSDEEDKRSKRRKKKEEEEEEEEEETSMRRTRRRFKRRPQNYEE